MRLDIACIINYISRISIRGVVPTVPAMSRDPGKNAGLVNGGMVKRCARGRNRNDTGIRLGRRSFVSLDALTTAPHYPLKLSGIIVRRHRTNDVHSLTRQNHRYAIFLAANNGGSGAWHRWSPKRFSLLWHLW